MSKRSQMTGDERAVMSLLPMNTESMADSMWATVRRLIDRGEVRLEQLRDSKGRPAGTRARLNGDK